jgi:hypothetical protein
VSEPQRIQRKRTRDWRLPEGAVSVGRPTRWGNPWRADEWPFPAEPGGREVSVLCFRQMLDERRDYPPGVPAHDYPSDEEIRAELAGRDLACWCPLSSACHADALLELANGGAS